MTKTKAKLRAEAVERLKNLKDGMFCYTDAAAVVGINGYVNADMFRDALIDLLTDDCGPCYSCAKLAELMAENNALRAANDMKATESDVRTLGVDANDASVDSREKLEADCEKFIGNIQRRIFSGRDAGALRCQLKELLDRQAAITERHWMEIVGASANANVELKRQIDERQARVDELTEQLETAYAKNRSLKAHIAKMQEGRHGWHVKGVELQREVDKLARENISLARDLSECMAERDNWRYRWHQVRVLMDEPLQCGLPALVDMNGEVAS